MTKQNKTKFKKGAASFYVVAFSTLILIIIVASFAAIIVSVVIRAANEDLSQSAYDSALAGIEDAKVAYYNYLKCKEEGAVATEPNGDSSLTCGEIIWYMEHLDCDMVAHILGRIGETETSTSPDGLGGVKIQETNKNGNDLEQAYTCVTIETNLENYKATLTDSNPVRVVRVKLAETEADKIKYMTIKWNGGENNGVWNFSNTISGQNVNFPNSKDASVPPILGVSLVQTAENFTLDDFDKVEGDNSTNRGTVFFVPTNNTELTSGLSDNYEVIYDESEGNRLGYWELVKSNDRTVKNVPYIVYCDEEGCSVKMDLPGVIGQGAKRNDDTFLFVVSLPYGGSTDVTLTFFCDDTNNSCGTLTANGGEKQTNQATLAGIQINIDSTGRANDLYRRVEARLDTGGAFPYPLYGLELLDTSTGKVLLDKNFAVTSEHSSGEYEADLNGRLKAEVTVFSPVVER